MTADGWCSIGGSACKQYTASTALVLWNYIIALEPKCMLSEVAPMLLHRCLVSAECFSRFFGGVFCLFGDFEWCYCKKTTTKNMGNVVCVWDRVSMVHVCLCIIFVAALRDTYTHAYTPNLCAFSPNIYEHTLPFCTFGEQSGVKLKEYQCAHRLHHCCVKCKRVSACCRRL